MIRRLSPLTLARQLLLVMLLAITSLTPATTRASDPFAACDPEGEQENGARYLICVPPANWNGKLLIYAHGYVAPDEPLKNDLELNGVSAVTAAHLLGYAFAATSYSHNGLAILDGVESVVDLVKIFEKQKGKPERIYLLGISQGGLVATLAIEQFSYDFDGGLALCGPYGDFEAQLNYFTDARVVFDYYFPEVLPPNPVDIPQALFDGWDAYYETNVKSVLVNADKVEQMMAVAKIPYNANPNDDLSDAEARAAAIQEVLWYNVKATNDAIERLGGQPFDNSQRVYTGSQNDSELNAGVARFTADAAAVQEISIRYQTSGNLRVPLVTLHTTEDPVVPYDQVERYRQKVEKMGRSDYYDHIRVEGYGHCAFNIFQIQNALNRLEEMVATLPANPIYLPLISASTP
jgi:alpha-beta hydrolase superfamily lysophospholipase